MTLLEKINNLTWYDLINKLKDILKGLLPQEAKYKVYTALLNQSGTDAPVATVLENTLGEITFTYSGQGEYAIISDELFIQNKTVFFSPVMATIDQAICNTFYLNSSSEVLFATYNVEDNTEIDNALENTPIEIRVYN